MFNGICFNQDIPRHKRSKPLFEKLKWRPSERENCSVEEYCGCVAKKEIEQSSALLVHIVKDGGTYCGLTQWRCGQCTYKPECGGLKKAINEVLMCVNFCEKCISMALSELSSLQTGIDKYALPIQESKYRLRIGSRVRLIAPGKWKDGIDHGIPHIAGNITHIREFTTHREEEAAIVEGSVLWPIRAMEIVN